MMNQNEALFSEAKQIFSKGVDAANRYHDILGYPLYITRADGSHMIDVDGKDYLDFHTSAGAALFGYNNPRLMNAAKRAIERGAFMNYNTAEHIELGKLMQRMIPCAERVRLCNTGTEATQAAIRLARGYTGRDLCIRMEGHFHGMHELVWYNHNAEGAMDAEGEIETLPDTGGVPLRLRELVKNVEFNDIETLEHVVKRYQGQVACVIMEPISFNCGCYPARKAYLEAVRSLCTREGIVLIFDEVVTGLRLRPGTAQGYYGITPDLATFAKAIGGTFQIAALCGREHIMDVLAPSGSVVMSGTYTGSLMSVLASIECFQMAMEPGFYEKLEQKADMLYGGINALFAKHGIPGHIRGYGARFGIFFGVDDPEADFNWRSLKRLYNVELARSFVKQALAEGMYFVSPGRGPVAPHCGFSTAHTDEDFDMALAKIDRIFTTL